MRLVFFLLVLCPNALGQWWSVQTSGLPSNLRGISVTNGRVNGKQSLIVWASGSHGVILRSTDKRSPWNLLGGPGGGDLDFRDIEAFGEDTAYVMSSGEGDKSRIYKTTDGSKTWKLQYSDQRRGFFLDSLACDSKIHCVALSDPVDGKFLVLSTNDGERWKELPRDKMPDVLNGEGAFAASGTAIALCGHDHIYFGTGGGRVARVFHSKDSGRSWTAVETPIAGGNASRGIFSVACGADLLVAVGGDYKEPGSAQGTAAYYALGTHRFSEPERCELLRPRGLGGRPEGDYRAFQKSLHLPDKTGKVGPGKIASRPVKPSSWAFPPFSPARESARPRAQPERRVE